MPTLSPRRSRGDAPWNAYVAERLAIGHWGFLLGLAALPWAFRRCAAVRRGRPGAVPAAVPGARPGRARRQHRPGDWWPFSCSSLLAGRGWRDRLRVGGLGRAHHAGRGRPVAGAGAALGRLVAGRPRGRGGLRRPGRHPARSAAEPGHHRRHLEPRGVAGRARRVLVAVAALVLVVVAVAAGAGPWRRLAGSDRDRRTGRGSRRSRGRRGRDRPLAGAAGAAGRGPPARRRPGPRRAEVRRARAAAARLLRRPRGATGRSGTCGGARG